MAILSGLKGLQNLKILDLQWNEITADGAAALGSSKYFLNLKNLQLWGNYIGEEGARSIVESETLKNVTNTIYPYENMEKFFPNTGGREDY